MKYKAFLILASVLLTLVGVTCTLAALAFPWAKVTVRVLDDQGKPLPGAQVLLGFEMPDFRGMGTANTGVKGDTNAAGEFSGAAECATGSVEFFAHRADYYWTNGKKLELIRGTTDTYWSPWNPIQTLALKKIIQPVPMYARQDTGIHLPVENEPVGFDLVARDWVAPYGKGNTADFIFKVTKQIKSELDYSGELRLSFSNSGDGIQRLDPARDNTRCELRSPQVAPIGGYAPVLALLTGASPNVEGNRVVTRTSQMDDNYLFRVRTVRRDDGTILSACYGKIYGPIQYSLLGLKYLGPQPKFTSIVFGYYLNPDDQSRSLEFDAKHNLFTDLHSFEKPNEP